MILPDINSLIYAYNRDAPHHRTACAWWEELMNGTVPVAIPWIVSCGFIRIMTHPRVLEKPMSVTNATHCVQQWLDQPVTLTIDPGRRFAEILFRYLNQLGTAGNLTTDAQLAALAVEHQAELHSNDTDFGRFEGLRWINPFKTLSSD